MAALQTPEEIRAYFDRDRYAKISGIVIEEVSPRHAVCTMEIRDIHRNAENGVMGGAIFTLVDLAAAAAASGIHMPTVAQQVSISFLSNSRGTRLTASAECRKDGKTTTVYNVNVTDDLGRDIAQAVVTGYKLNR